MSLRKDDMHLKYQERHILFCSSQHSDSDHDKKPQCVASDWANAVMLAIFKLNYFYFTLDKVPRTPCQLPTYYYLPFMHMECISLTFSVRDENVFFWVRDHRNGIMHDFPGSNILLLRAFMWPFSFTTNIFFVFSWKLDLTWYFDIYV